MRFRFILSETWNSLKRNVSMIISVMLVTFISFLFIGVSGLMQAQITAAKGEWYDKVEVVVWLCPDGASQAASKKRASLSSGCSSLRNRAIFLP